MFTPNHNLWTAIPDWVPVPFLRRLWLHYRMGLLLLFIAVPVALVAGFSFAKFGVLTLALAFAALGLMLVITIENDIYLYYLAFLLCGYIFFSKGFAYVGFFPIYVSEIGIAAGIGTILVLFFINRRNLRLQPLLRLEVVFLLLFIASQLPATVPYFGEYGINVIRDAMQYLYAIYTLCIGILLPPSSVKRLIYWYHKFFPAIVFWIPIFFLVARTMDVRL